MRRVVAMAVAMGCGAPLAANAQAGDAAAGRVLAERWCSACHVVDAEQAQGNDAVPTFRAIGTKSWTELKFGMAMASPHPPMPTLDLTRRELADLLAFVRRQAAE
ncbi:c-type cytochrome [Blastochloris viridis]|uniref:Cytochrome c552 n=1 Tax=Blastochloris viridis TaxID=1079 RepID=A0A0H5BBI8_BLAVI|nr:c-type cytochrome [Blastochloris viridis]ALK08265.1 Cytochrome c-552 precursor [Blastochloris viridis]BAR98469.1 small molecule metabolism [Blastochloris viridis]CUU44187.1 Cytochrome c552 [Blastochloris viridis]